MHTLIQALAELILMLVHFPLSLTLPLISWEPKPGLPGKPTIILVERWIKRNPLHIFLKKYLEGQGYSVHSINFPMLEDSFPQSARDLRDYIKAHNLQGVVLIGLSNGGLTCYEYLENFRGWNKAHLLITLGSPFGGASRAHLLFGTEVKHEIDPRGEYIAHIRGITSEHLNNIYCIGARIDQMVGAKNCYLPGAHHIEINVVGHNLLHTLWRPVFRKVHEIITQSRDATQR